MTREKGASAPQRRSHHLTAENFERDSLQLPRGERNGSAGQGLCRSLILPGQNFCLLERRLFSAHFLLNDGRFLCIIELHVAGWSHSDCG